MSASRPSARGFTLAEMLVVAPVVILAIGGFIVLMVSMVGSVLITRDRNAMTYNIQDALNRIEEDTRLTAQFQTDTGTLTSPQGSNNNTAAFSSSSALILNSFATDKNPTDTSRQLVYYAGQPNPCGAKQNLNRVFLIRTIYFVKNGSLWRRSIVPTYNNNGTPDANTICGGVWQRNSCAPGTTTAPCETNDAEIMQNVDSFDVKYYAEAGNTTALPDSQADGASTIEVTINGKKTVAGRELTSSGTITATKSNGARAEAPPIAKPSVAYDTAEPDSLADPSAVVFRWDKSPTATAYLISYSVSGGGWTNTTVGPTTDTYTVTANRLDTITFKVAAKNGTETSPYTTSTATVPAWGDYILQSGWGDFSQNGANGGYGVHNFTKTKSGMIVLKGLVKNGANGSVIGVLPPGYRPSERTLLLAETDSNVAGRIDVLTNGQILTQSVSSAWASMDNMRFMPSSTSWTTLPLQTPWGNYGTGWTSPGYTKTSDGMVMVKGLVANGANGSLIATLPVGYRPAERMLFAVQTSSNANGRVDVLPDGRIIGVSISPYWVSLENIRFMPSGTSWIPMSLQPDWQQYDSTYPAPAYTKTSAGLVVLKGLIKFGANGSLIATLPAGYRPAERLLFAVETNNQANGRIDVLPDGRIYSQRTDAGWASMDNISFIAEQ